MTDSGVVTVALSGRPFGARTFDAVIGGYKFQVWTFSSKPGRAQDGTTVSHAALSPAGRHVSAETSRAERLRAAAQP